MRKCDFNKVAKQLVGCFSKLHLNIEKKIVIKKKTATCKSPTIFSFFSFFFFFHMAALQIKKNLWENICDWVCFSVKLQARGRGFSKFFCKFRTVILINTWERLILHKGSSIQCERKIFRKKNISDPLIRTWMCAYQEVRNASFSKNFADVLNLWSPKKC